MADQPFNQQPYGQQPPQYNPQQGQPQYQQPQQYQQPYQQQPPQQYQQQPPQQYQQPYQQPQYQQPRYQQPNAAMGEKPNNNMVWAILSTILCCWPLGLVGIINATKVDTLWAQGDAQGAREKAKAAKTWAIVAIVAGFVFIFIYSIFMILTAFLG